MVGADNLSYYYDVSRKLARLALNSAFRHVLSDIADQPVVAALFEQERPDVVINLAVQLPVGSIRAPTTG